MYTEDILEESRHPSNVGSIENPTVTVEEKNSSCGDNITIDLQLSAGPDPVLIDIKWRGAGCAISQASMSLLSEQVKSMPVSQVLQLQKADMEQILGLEEPISMGRIKCVTLGLTALKHAIKKIA